MSRMHADVAEKKSLRGVLPVYIHIYDIYTGYDHLFKCAFTVSKTSRPEYPVCRLMDCLGVGR
jgi:hypothetical protein